MDETAPATAAVRAGIDTDATHHAVVPPVYLSTNYTFEAPGVGRGFEYSRSGNPTRRVFADALATLEGGVGATVTSSGMAAITVVLHAFVRPGDRVVVPYDCYGGTWRLVQALAGRGMFELHVTDLTDPDVVAEALATKPALVLIETPSNPLLRITDVRAVADAAHAAGALVVADNTFCSPAGQNPIALGADLVVHSTTKYINGHSDVVGGAVVAATSELHEAAQWWSNALGVTGGALDSYLSLRGLRTLDLRYRAHAANALAVARLAAGHPAVEGVYYPGLATHPGHDIAARQQHSFGGIVSVVVRHGAEGVEAFLDGLRLFCLAESLGGVESLVAHPLSMTHAAMPADVAARAGLVPGLLRLSVGIEDGDDLVRDVKAGLDRVAALD